MSGWWDHPVAVVLRRVGVPIDAAPVLPVEVPGTTAAGDVEVGIDPTATGASWWIANRGDEPVVLDAVGVRVDAGPAGDDPVLWCNGYQSWSPTGARRLGRSEDPSRHPDSVGFLRAIHHADPTPARPHELRSEQVAVLAASGGARAAAGFVGGARHAGTVRARVVDGRVELLLEAWLGGARLDPGEVRVLHDLWAMTGDDASTLLETWAATSGDAERARVTREYLVGWCSWYHYFHDVDEAALRDNLARAADWPFEVFQLDDGYQAAIGDWLRAGPRFPSGVDGVASAIAAAGRTPGLWLAPFLAAPDSEVARRHPDWMAGDPARTEPLMGMYHPEWGGVMWQLDVTRPEVLAHLEQTAAALREMGYRYLKLDFTFSSAVAGTYADPTRTPAERVRAGYEAVRRGLGDDGYLLACGCPLGAVVGVVDAMRIGPDVAPTWERSPDTVAFPGYEGAAPATRHAWDSTLARSFQHRRLWSNDPDCLMLRAEQTALAPDQARAWALAVGVSGGLALVSDDLALLDDPARALLDEVVALGRDADRAARAGHPPRCHDLLDPAGPTTLSSGATRLVADPDDPHPELVVDAPPRPLGRSGPADADRGR